MLPSAPPNSTTVRLWIGRGLALALVIGTILFMWRVYEATGLFISIGMDYGLYLAQATVMGGDDPSKIYDKSVTNLAYRHLLDLYAHDPHYDPAAPGNWASHVPYPPIFAWAMQPLTWIAPSTSVFVWACANTLLALWIGWRVALHCPGSDKPTVMLLFLGSYPVVLNLHVGQIQILLAWVVTECYLALRADHDFRAGVWLGCLLVKPHYGLLLGLLLLWKGRWKAVLGVALTGSVLLFGSLWVGGMQTLLAYPQAFSDMVQFRGDSPIVMLNWRSIVLDWYPSIYWRSGIILTVCLGIATALCVGWVWRGPWNPSAEDFPAKMLLTLLATIIILYHSHPYGAAILVMPLAAVVLSEQASRMGQGIACAGAILPTIIFTHGHPEPLSDWDLNLHLELASQILKATVIALCAHTFIDLIQSTHAEDVPAEPAQTNLCAVHAVPSRHGSAHHSETTPQRERPAANG
ncbi:MAG: glycosyltransferase family 87 protein [Nitrospirota bacterium]